ncbi:MAG: glycosyltransferase [Bacteroidales bacterium]|nr:glycosyltransferase [Bacteroidales bacterium]
MKKFSIITPCYNAEKFIEATLLSVINQSAVLNDKCNLEYIICDGGSKDNTVAIAQKLLVEKKNCEFKILSSKDNGMYDALSKGLMLISGDYCAYINAGDIYSPYAFEILLEILKFEKIKWVTGIRVIYNENSQIVNVRLPFKYKRIFIKLGLYGRILPYIQQESTFWKSELNQLIDIDYFSKLKFAGDFYLWYSFAQKNNLYIMEAFLAGFKRHIGQKSENLHAYNLEKRKFISKNYLMLILLFPVILFELMFFLPDYLKDKLNRKTIIRFDHKNGKWKLPFPD